MIKITALKIHATMQQIRNTDMRMLHSSRRV